MDIKNIHSGRCGNTSNKIKRRIETDSVGTESTFKDNQGDVKSKCSELNEPEAAEKNPIHFKQDKLVKPFNQNRVMKKPTKGVKK